MTPNPDPGENPRTHGDSPQEAPKQIIRAQVELTRAISRLVRERIEDVPPSARGEYEAILRQEVEELSAALDLSVDRAAARVVDATRRSIDSLIAERVHTANLESLLREFTSETEMVSAVYKAAQLALGQRQYFLAVYQMDNWQDVLGAADGYREAGNLQCCFRGYDGRQFGEVDGMQAFSEALEEAKAYLEPYLKSRDAMQIGSDQLFEGGLPGAQSKLCFTNETILTFPSRYGAELVGALFVAVPSSARLKPEAHQALRLVAHDFASGLAHLKRMNEVDGGNFGS